ncbi:nucleotide exchange factor GrpE [Marinigracilibium pacificum]|uniref:Protein GrpE n=1 Tax=Marinigracilibium pacificum TaxID=2729599 RepID=A0A848IZZ3_9BACT|nr:nucleotide exchange factor GrpE [Marinigracilibium pacificum]NMM48708.1 nucleotide exchange factor GrpE [Marinigracilibium pacificum]
MSSSQKDTKNQQEQEVKDINQEKEVENAVEEKELGKEQNESENQSEESKLKAEVDSLNDKYIRLYSEFENYRRRTAKERLEMVKTAGEDILKDLLPIMDDFERGLNAMKDENPDVVAGVKLIHDKLARVLESKGVKVMDVNQGSVFDADFQEAVTAIPSPSPELKGKVVDVIEKGYMIDEKVLRFAKVVIGS